MTCDMLLDLLLECGSVEKAAEKSGKTALSLRKMMRTPPFKNITRSVRDTALSQSVTKLIAFAPACADILFGLAKDETAPGAVRISAARSILTISTKMTEVSDILDRIDLLENDA